MNLMAYPEIGHRSNMPQIRSGRALKAISHTEHPSTEIEKHFRDDKRVCLVIATLVVGDKDTVNFLEVAYTGSEAHSCYLQILLVRWLPS